MRSFGGPGGRPVVGRKRPAKRGAGGSGGVGQAYDAGYRAGLAASGGGGAPGRRRSSAGGSTYGGDAARSSYGEDEEFVSRGGSPRLGWRF